MNHQWPPQVSRALHQFADAAPDAPSLASLLDHDEPDMIMSGSTIFRDRPSRRRLVIAYAAIVVVIGVAGIAVSIRSSDSGEHPAPAVTVAPAPAVLPAPTTVAPASTLAPTPTTVDGTTTTSTLPNLRMPGTNPNNTPAREYGWTSGQKIGGWMHNVIETSDGWRQTQLNFVVRDDCFAEAPGSEPRAVRVAGLDGWYLEPYDDGSVGWSSSSPAGGETTAAYALPIGETTLCVYLRWDAATTPSELDAARAVVASIRGQPYGENDVRINFTLPAGWDTG